MENKKTVFETLASINVNEKIEKKNGLTYLSWAFAWGEVKKAYPSATYQIVSDPISKRPYFFDENLGYMVMTEVTIEDQTLEMWLPVMDGANKSMTYQSYTYQTRYGEKVVEAATMFDINKTLMRCLTKNLAMFGLGHYIYAGEDLPETETPVTPIKAAAPAKDELETLKLSGDNWEKVKKYVTANKQLGEEKILQQLGTKYIITPTTKKEIIKIINS
jgi:hypothetical protein